MLDADIYRKGETLRLFMTKEAYLLKNEINCPGATQAYSCSMCNNVRFSFANTTALAQHFQLNHSLFEGFYQCDQHECNFTAFSLNHMTQRHRTNTHGTRRRYQVKKVPMKELSKPEEALLFTIAPQTLTSPSLVAPIGTQGFQGVSWQGFVCRTLGANRLPEVRT